MRLLLDSHVLLWQLSADPRLGARARAAIESAENEAWVSAATVWELEIKAKLGKLAPPAELLPTLLDAGAVPLAISAEHAQHAARLPLHHADPFDRMLVAQAQLEGMAILSADPAIGRYDVHVLDAGVG